MTDDPLISEYLPMVNAHIATEYRRVTERGNCLLTVDDLQQIAAIALIKLVARWDDILAEQGKEREGNGGLFWWYLKGDVKRAVWKYFDRVAHGDRAADTSSDAVQDTPEIYHPDIRTALRARPISGTWSVVIDDVIEYFQVMPTRDKIQIALRYFDELPWKEAADILGMHRNTLTNLTLTAVNRWRIHTRNQFVTEPENLARVPGRQPQAWDIPESLSTYIETRYRVDVHTYLWFVTECFRADASYLVDLFGNGRHEVPGNHGGALSPYQQHQVDLMLGAGMSKKEVSRRLDVTYGVVVGHAKRRHAA